MQEDACGRVMAGEAPHACEAACGGPSLEEKKTSKEEGTTERNHPILQRKRLLGNLNNLQINLGLS